MVTHCAGQLDSFFCPDHWFINNGFFDDFDAASTSKNAIGEITDKKFPTSGFL